MRGRIRRKLRKVPKSIIQFVKHLKQGLFRRASRFKAQTCILGQKFSALEERHAKCCIVVYKMVFQVFEIIPSRTPKLFSFRNWKGSTKAAVVMALSHISMTAVLRVESSRLIVKPKKHFIERSKSEWRENNFKQHIVTR